MPLARKKVIQNVHDSGLPKAIYTHQDKAIVNNRDGNIDATMETADKDLSEFWCHGVFLSAMSLGFQCQVQAKPDVAWFRFAIRWTCILGDDWVGRGDNLTTRENKRKGKRVVRGCNGNRRQAVKVIRFNRLAQVG